jgi:hypothetical protein
MAGATVIKRAIDYPRERLFNQANKQAKFYYYNSTKDIIIPKVLDYTRNSFSMEFIQHIDIITFLGRASKLEIERFVDILIDFIEQCLAQCQIRAIHTDLIKKKYNSVKPDNRLDFTFCSLPREITIPHGMCHGDLTFSNVLYHNGKVVLIDFLDSFIETPLMDISKIWQDTKHNWTIFHNNLTDSTRIQTVFQYINDRIYDRFHREEWFIYCYMFEALTLMRILPYCQNQHTTNFILERLKCVL